MADIVERLRQGIDIDNTLETEAAMDQAADEITRLRATPDITEALRGLIEWAEEYCQNGKCPTYDAIWPAKQALTAALSHRRDGK